MGDVTCVIGQGFNAMFGGGLVLVVMSLILSLILVYKMRLPLDLTVIGLLGLTTALTYSILPGYVFYVGLLFAAIIAGYGFYKWSRR